MKRTEMVDKTERLVTGIQKIKDASEQVAGLKQVLEKEQVVVKEKSESTAALLEYVGKEKVLVGEQNEIAQAEESKTNKIVTEVDAFARDCANDLAAAKPIVDAALAVPNKLDNNSLTELKSMGKPPDNVVMVTASVMTLMADPKKIPKDKSWVAAKKMMANVTGWMKDLLGFDCNEIPQACVDQTEPIIQKPNFTPEVIKTKSQAAASHCTWVVNMVVNMVKYHHIRCEVKPKEETLAEVQEKLVQSLMTATAGMFKVPFASVAHEVVRAVCKYGVRHALNDDGPVQTYLKLPFAVGGQPGNYGANHGDVMRINLWMDVMINLVVLSQIGHHVPWETVRRVGALAHRAFQRKAIPVATDWTTELDGQIFLGMGLPCLSESGRLLCGAIHPQGVSDECLVMCRRDDISSILVVSMECPPASHKAIRALTGPGVAYPGGVIYVRQATQQHQGLHVLPEKWAAILCGVF